MVIDSLQQPESLPADQLIGYEVHAPTVIGTLSDRTSFANLNAHPPTWLSPPECDAKCDAVSANRIELLTRAVILVAGMNLAEDERAAVLARVIADLTSPTTRIPE